MTLGFFLESVSPKPLSIPLGPFRILAPVAKFTAGIVDIGCKFAPVSLIPAVHLDLQLSPQIFEKIQSDPDIIFRGVGKDDSGKKHEAKNLVTTIPFKHISVT